MEKWKIFFLLFFLPIALSQVPDTSNWVRIDCGARTTSPAGGYTDWETDEEYIKTGTDRQVSRNNYHSITQLNTLRVFTQQNKNCYILPTPTMERYFFRAVFYYGNYDGQSKPPTFDLQIDGNKWNTVVTSATTANFYEAIYTSNGENTSVCLARTQEKQFPLINLLEAWPLAVGMYPGMDNNIAWFKSYRYNYGVEAKPENWILGYPDDDYNRIWEPMIPSGVNPVSADFSYLSYTTDEYPPTDAIIHAIEAQTPADSIILSFALTGTTSLIHVVVYFTEVKYSYDENDTRIFEWHVNDDLVWTIIPQYENATDFGYTVQTTSTLNMELRPVKNSTLPPIISAIEIYTASDPLAIMPTSQDDLEGLAVFTSTYEQLWGWSGDPCLPSDTVWEWVECTGNNPPRVTSIKLSGYGLDGPLADFNQMQALETIDLSNNSLNGPIPEFLGNLPNLHLLNLRDNNFSGDVPNSIKKNKKLKLDVKGNHGIHHKRKRLALIIGLAVGLPLGLILLFGILYIISRKQPPPNQGQPLVMELGRPPLGVGAAPGKPQDDTISVSASTEGLINHTPANGNATPMTMGNNNAFAANGLNTNQNSGNTNYTHQENEEAEPRPPARENPPSYIGSGSTNHQSAVSNTNTNNDDDDDEDDGLDELLEEHGKKGASRRA